MNRRTVLMVLVAVAAAGAAPAAVLRVEQDGSGEFLLIQDAVNAAADGDTILIGPGRYDDLQPRGFNNVVCVARWDDGRGLTFVGEHRDSVIIGPTTYLPDGTGPQGIHQHEPADIVVQSVTFTNLRAAVVANRGTILVDGVRFSTGEAGLAAQAADTIVVRGSSFAAYPAAQHIDGQAVIVNGAEYAEIADCEFTDAMVYFGNVPNGILRNCVCTGGPFAGYALSGGLIEGCVAAGSIWAYSRNMLRIQDNTLTGGSFNVMVYGQETQVIMERNTISSPSAAVNIRIRDDIGSFVAHDNDIRVGSEYAVRVSNVGGVGPIRHFDMSNNYWFENGTPAALDSLIYDGNDDKAILAIVDYEPIRSNSVPAQAKSFGEIKSLYR